MAAFTPIKEIGGEDDPPNFEYARIVEAGTAHQFSQTTKENWEAETRPILEAFWHTWFAKYSINVRPSFLTTHVSQSGRYLFEASYPEGTRAEAP